MIVRGRLAIQVQGWMGLETDPATNPVTSPATSPAMDPAGVTSGGFRGIMTIVMTRRNECLTQRAMVPMFVICSFRLAAAVAFARSGRRHR